MSRRVLCSSPATATSISRALLQPISRQCTRRPTYNNSNWDWHTHISASSSHTQTKQRNSSSQAEGHRMADKPPQHKMAYFPKLMSARREFGLFRRVLHTGLYSQLVAMEVPIGGEIGDEIHTVDQALFFTHGSGRAIVAGKEQDLSAGDLVIVPAGTQHQFLNTGDVPLELLTVYSPAEHNATTVHQTKQEGDEAEEAGRDEPPAWSQNSKAENQKLGYV